MHWKALKGLIAMAITQFHTKFAQSRTFFLLNTIAQTRTFLFSNFAPFLDNIRMKALLKQIGEFA